MKTFLSSTYVDLVSHRKAAAEAVERLGQQVGRMEVFGARPAEPSTACLTEIDECDLFVGIYAHRYGYVPDGSLVSITEAEFDHAKSNNKPLFCFLVHEDHPWPPNMIEDEPGRSKLRDFKKKVGSGLVRDTFTTCEDLAYKIAASLGRYLSTINNTETVPTTDPDLSKGHTEFFDKILSEIANLRLELQGQKELLQKVNHISYLLQPSDKNTQAIQRMNKKLPSDLEGCWRDSRSGSTLYARFLGEDLVVPYCYGGASTLTGVFFDFRRRTEDVFFARFKWINSPLQGFAYIERSGSDTASGGWWYSEDVPREALEDLERFDHHLPRMNDLRLSRRPQPRKLPQWVDDFFSIPKNELLNQLQMDA
jgi:hypothetical protein